ncbi:MAG: universal stress protein [Planctomycetes bacterium]|nr:universal stress protein [Planctomycetota bacterium]
MNLRRILLALDATAREWRGLEELAALAARLEAELVGLFVEDLDLLHAAARPEAREIGLASASAQVFDPQALDRTLRGLARRAERRLAEVAGRRQARWSFQVARGRVPAELLGAAAGADLLVVGRSSRRGTPRRRLGSTARRILAAREGPVLLLPPETTLQAPVVAWIDAAEDVPAVAGVAGTLAAAAESSLTVHLAADTPEGAAALAAAWQEWSPGGAPAARVVAHGDAAALARARRDVLAHAGVLVLRQGGRWLREAGVEAVAEAVGPVLLVS